MAVSYDESGWSTATANRSRRPAGSDSGISFLAAEGSPEQYVVRLRKADEKRLDLVSYGAASAEDVDTLAEQLLAGGVQLISQPGKVDTPGGGYGFRFFDVDGRTIEVSADVEARQHRKIEEKESIPVKLSHVVINTPDLNRTRKWYEQHLGFSLSDSLMHPRMGEVMHFMRINSLHHSIFIAQGPLLWGSARCGVTLCGGSKLIF